MAGETEEKDDVPTTNHLISRRIFREFVAGHPGTKKDAPTFLRWCKAVETADWRNFGDVRETFPGADQVGDLVVFNVGGNKYRVVAHVRYRPDKPAWVYVRSVLTHKEYDKGV